MLLCAVVGLHVGIVHVLSDSGRGLPLIVLWWAIGVAAALLIFDPSAVFGATAPGSTEAVGWGGYLLGLLSRVVHVAWYTAWTVVAIALFACGYIVTLLARGRQELVLGVLLVTAAIFLAGLLMSSAVHAAPAACGQSIPAADARRGRAT